MKLRFTIILGYTTMFLWIWMLSELESTDLSEKITRTIPMCGMMGTGSWMQGQRGGGAPEQHHR